MQGQSRRVSRLSEAHRLTGFLAMNIDRHVNAHFDFFDHLVTGDRD
jgi:poly-beta-hydroxyalkanoate depolymerase